MNSPRLFWIVPALAVTALILTSCDGPDRRAMMEEARHSVPPMAADQAYFDGQIAVHLMLGGTGHEGGMAGGREGGGKNKMTSMKDVNMGEGNFGGGMGGGGMGSGGGMNGDSGRVAHGSQSDTYQGNEGMGHVIDGDEAEPDYVRRRREAEMPGALMRLSLENTSAATVVVEIHDVNSDLGNFAVRPDTITLSPGQTIETDPMLSKLGVDSYSLPVTITLRSGGKTETKTLTLHLVNPANPPSPAQR
jgi:hypothetical protein